VVETPRVTYSNGEQILCSQFQTFFLCRRQVKEVHTNTTTTTTTKSNCLCIIRVPGLISQVITKRKGHEGLSLLLVLSASFCLSFHSIVQPLGK
jgi:hypothetical protein